MTEKQKINDIDFITIEEAAEMTRGTRVTFVPGMQAIFAEALKNLKIKFAWIVHSNDGLDEISPYDITNVCQLNDGKIDNIKINPKSIL